MKTLHMLLIALCGDAIVAVGDITAKRWTLTGAGLNRYLIISMLCYTAVAGLWMLLLRTCGDLGRSSIWWVASGTIVPILIGRFVFNETIGANMWIGVGLCALGVAFTAASP